MTGLAGEIMTVQLAEGLTLPTLPALRIPVIYDIPDAPVLRVDVGPLEVIGPPAEPADEIPAPATPALTGTLNIPIENITLPTESLILSATIALMETDITPPVDAVYLQGAINLLSSDIAAPPLPIPLQGVINADLNKTFTEPIALAGVINATVNIPDLPEGFVDVGEIEVIGPPDDPIPTPPDTAESIPGIINAELNKLFSEPVQIAGVVNARANIAAASGGTTPFREGEEDPENEMLDIGNLTGEIDSLSISDEVKALLEPVLLDGEINATLVKLFSEPVIIDGIINAQINYATGATFDQGGGGGGEGGSVPGGGQQAPNIGNFNPQTPGDQPQQGGFNFNPQGGLFANRNAGGGGGGNAIQVTFPASLRNAITGQAGTLKEIQVSQKEFYQSSIAFFDNAGARGLTTNQHLSGIRRALLSEDAPLVPLATETTLQTLATETTLLGIAETLNKVQLATERIADQPLVDQLIEAGVAFPNDPNDPTNAAFTESPIPNILGRGGITQFAASDAIQQQFPVDLLQIGSEELPGFFNVVNTAEIAEILAPTEDLLGSAGNPSFTQIMNFPETQKVEITNETLNVQGQVDANITNEVGVRQVGTFAVTQTGAWVMQLAGGGTIPVRVVGGRMEVDIASGLEGLAIELDEVEVGLRALGAI